MKIPKGIVEDVLVKVDNFYYPVDFVVLDIEPMEESTHQVPIILGMPFLATANSTINCRNGGYAAHLWQHDFGAHHFSFE